MPEVAAHRELAAAAEGIAAHRRDRRDGERFELAHDVVALLAEGLGLFLIEILHLRDVRAGDKGLLSRAADDQAADLA